MSGIEGFCKHGNVWRNCYSCHLEFTYPKEIIPMDTIYETISELKIRISKLEEYKRLQDDLNKMTDHQLENLHRHRLQQIDENRAVSKHLIDLDESYQGLSAELRHLLEQQEYVPFVESDYIDDPKTTGLTFEEALIALKGFKKIKRKHRKYVDHCEILDRTIKPAHEQVFIFPLEDLFSNDWEIIE